MDRYSALSDLALAAMTARAWREAARCWQEARRERDPQTRAMLTLAAESADAYWRDLVDEGDRRLAMAAGPSDAPSADRYEPVIPLAASRARGPVA